MLGKSPNQDQKNLFRPILKDLVNPKHALVVLAQEIDWDKLETVFSHLYSNTGTRSKPIRLMAGLLILKEIYNLGDETVMPQWVQNPYFQFFCGEAEFQWAYPCDPSDLARFRKRVGREGVEKIFRHSVKLHEKNTSWNDALISTTSKKKKIAYPPNAKLLRKVVENYNRLVQKKMWRSSKITKKQ